MICPVCDEHVDTHREHVEVLKRLNAGSLGKVHYHWSCWMKIGGEG